MKLNILLHINLNQIRFATAYVKPTLDVDEGGYNNCIIETGNRDPNGFWDILISRPRT